HSLALPPANILRTSLTISGRPSTGAHACHPPTEDSVSTWYRAMSFSSNAAKAPVGESPTSHTSPSSGLLSLFATPRQGRNNASSLRALSLAGTLAWAIPSGHFSRGRMGSL